MKIHEMFERKIDREIQGVVVVGQEEEQAIRQELEEYVVTRELQKHFADFFAAYKRGIVGQTPKMGVWISGFFGSGKSLLLKVFSYLLQNRQVAGKPTLDYFVEDGKIRDEMVLADMRLAAETPTDVILFNIDSKSDTNGKKDKDAIVNVFLKVFNEMQGFSGSIPHLADLERRLTEAGQYEAYKAAFQGRYGDSWENSRQDFDFIQDDVVDTLAEIGFMSESAARNWCEKALEPYQISIEDFAKRVRAYIEKQGGRHHVVFFVDEIGQYIGEDSRLMLNLQTVTEELGKECRGKAWVVVTSQQDIDSITKVKGNDFSKIQGRFDTRISLSSANVDAVIKERILKKNGTAAQTLRLLYEQKATVIKNLIVFNDEAEKKLYANAADFTAVYPFVPYQFNLLASVLSSIRTHGASGKHLSEGERSMLAMFKESAMAVRDEDIGALIPFHRFYDAMENFLDHSHKGVIIRAYDTNAINPEHKTSDVFAIDVLKTLFLVKYIKGTTANLDNLTSLIISSLDEDRIALRDRVEEALHVLQREALIQLHGDAYVFLTDEEQEINRAINAQNVEMSEVITQAAKLIYDEILKERRYRWPEFNGRYTFGYNQSVDDYAHRPAQSFEIGLRILTPWYDGPREDQTLRLMSGHGQEVLAALPDDDSFLQELQMSMKIENYLRNNTARQIPKFEEIKDAKRREMGDCAGRAKTFLIGNLTDAAVYVNGDNLRTSAKEPSARVNEAMGRLVQTIYAKLSYIDTAMGEADIRKLFRSDKQVTLDLGEQQTPNRFALEDMLAYITENSRVRHMKTSMKTLKERFLHAPFGFVDDDVHWLAARLFRNGDIDFFVNGEPVSRLDKTEDELLSFLTKKQYADKLLMDVHEKVSEADKRAVREILQELFHVGHLTDTDDEETMMQNFRGNGDRMIADIERREDQYQNKAYPGRNVLARGKALLQAVCPLTVPVDFFQAAAKRQNDFLDFAEAYEPLVGFFKGEQKTIFDNALKMLDIYEDSKTYIVDDTLESVVAEMRRIVHLPEPYREIPKLPELRQKFMNIYAGILKKEQAPVLASITEDRTRVLEELSGKPYEARKRDNWFDRFAELKDGAEHCNNVSRLRSYADKSNALKIRLLNEMAALDKPPEPGPEPGSADPVNPVNPVKPPKPYKPTRAYMRHFSIRVIAGASSWHLKSEADVDAHLAELRKALLTELEYCDIVNVEF